MSWCTKQTFLIKLLVNIFRFEPNKNEGKQRRTICPKIAVNSVLLEEYLLFRLESVLPLFF
jgi:hypothetical protein